MGIAARRASQAQFISAIFGLADPSQGSSTLRAEFKFIAHRLKSRL
jgi:hypothetical protein